MVLGYVGFPWPSLVSFCSVDEWRYPAYLLHLLPNSIFVLSDHGDELRHLLPVDYLLIMLMSFNS